MPCWPVVIPWSVTFIESGNVFGGRLIFITYTKSLPALFESISHPTFAEFYFPFRFCRRLMDPMTK